MPQTVSEHLSLVAHVKRTAPRYTDPPVARLCDDSRAASPGQSDGDFLPHGSPEMQMVAVLMALLVVGLFATMAWAIWG